jgi:hypothetical protein
MKYINILILISLSQLLVAQNTRVHHCVNDTINGLYICIETDSTTWNKDLGFSYRILSVRDKENGSELRRTDLKLNFAHDFPYFLNKDFLDETGILLIQGAQCFYLYQPANNELSDRIMPSYEACAFSDAQGTYISNIMILNNGSTLSLEIRECGVKEFDIRDINQISQK